MDGEFESFKEQVRSTANIVEVISGYVPLKKRGQNFWGCCPFHGEKTPSFAVNPAKKFWQQFFSDNVIFSGNKVYFINIRFYSIFKDFFKKSFIVISTKEKLMSYKIYLTHIIHLLLKKN